MKARFSAILLLVVTSNVFLSVTKAQEAQPLQLEASQPVEVRVDDLIKRMTLKEKAGQLNLPCVYVDQLGKTVPEKMAAARKFAAGTYTTEIGPGAGFFTLADQMKEKDLATQVNFFNELQK